MTDAKASINPKSNANANVDPSADSNSHSHSHVRYVNEPNFPKAEIVPLAYGHMGEEPMTAIDSRQAIVDPDSGEIYSIVTPGYGLHKHEDVLDRVEKALSNHPEFGQCERIVDLIPGGTEGQVHGARMQAIYRFPEVEYDLDGTGEDLINPEIRIRNSYDGSWALRGMFGAFRVICENGLVVGEKMAEYRKEHHQRIKVGELEETIQAGMKQFSDQIELWKQWADEIMDQEAKEKVLEDLKLSKSDREVVGNELEVETGLNLWDESVSKWIVFNILTQWLTHQVGSRMKQAKVQARLARVL